MGNIRGSVVVIASLVLVSACSLGSEDDAGSETVTVTSSSSPSSASPSSTQETRTETATATATASSSSATDPGSSPSEDGAVDGLPSDVGDYADGFVRAWGIGDREDASRYATDSTVSTLFALEPRGGSSWTRTEEDQQGGRTQVSYTDDEGMTLYVLVDTDTAGSGDADAVVAATLEHTDSEAESEGDGDAGASVSETTTGAYCDAFVRAWGAGERGTADDYAMSSVMTELFDHHGTGGSGWSQTSVTGGTAVYTDTDGTKLTLYVDTVSVENGWGDGIYHAELTS